MFFCRSVNLLIYSKGMQREKFIGNHYSKTLIENLESLHGGKVLIDKLILWFWASIYRKKMKTLLISKFKVPRYFENIDLSFYNKKQEKCMNDPPNISRNANLTVF